MQLEQEIDMILEKNGVFSSALQDWSNKWAPIILQYSSSLSGKKSMLASQIRTDCEGIYTCSSNIIMPFSTYTIIGHACRDDRAALKLLLQKKSMQDSVVHIYKEYEVRQ